VKPTIPFSDFSKLDIRVGTVKKAKAANDTENLWVIEVDLAEEGSRQVIVSLSKKYKAEKLTGRQVGVVANLEPREIGGLRSEGTLLVAESGGEPVLISPETGVPDGTIIR
jgi:methionine--tRNA ligase beta chain